MKIGTPGLRWGDVQEIAIVTVIAGLDWCASKETAPLLFQDALGVVQVVSTIAQILKS